MKPEEFIPDYSAAMPKRLKHALEYLWKVQEYPLASYELVDETKIYNKYGNKCDLYFEIWTKPKVLVGKFALSFMPGCENGVLISHGVSICEGFHNQGIGQALNRLKSQAASLINVHVILATVNAKNTKERSLLQKNKWDEVVTFGGSRYGDSVVLALRIL